MAAYFTQGFTSFHMREEKTAAIPLLAPDHGCEVPVLAGALEVFFVDVPSFLESLGLFPASPFGAVDGNTP
jgi:hypothetical protein